MRACVRAYLNTTPVLCLIIIIIITEQSALLVCSDLPKYMKHNYNNDCSPVLKISASAI